MKWFFIMAVLGLNLSLAGCEEASSTETPPPVDKPTEILKNFEMNDIQNGVKHMKLVSEEGRIYEAKHIADVDQPLLYFYKEGKESSRLKAPFGRVQMETRDVEAWGGVTVITADSSTLTTDRLRYDPKLQKIFSKDPVHLEKPDSITDGIGIESDPELQVVKIGHQKARLRKGVTH